MCVCVYRGVAGARAHGAVRSERSHPTLLRCALRGGHPAQDIPSGQQQQQKKKLLRAIRFSSPVHACLCVCVQAVRVAVDNFHLHHPAIEQQFIRVSDLT